MKIIEASTENKATIYKLTMSQEIEKMSDHVGTILEVADWVHYKDTNNDGEEREVLAIRTNDGKTYATNSTTFRNNFLAIKVIFVDEGESFPRLRIRSGLSEKSGYEYIYCEAEV